MSRRNIVIASQSNPEKQALAKIYRQNMTPAETILWKAVRTNRLSGWHFRRQQVIDGFIVDFYCHAAGLVVEVDGPVHDQQTRQDADRDAVLQERGLRVLRVTNDEVRNCLDLVLEKILRAVEEPNPPAPFPTREGGA